MSQSRSQNHTGLAARAPFQFGYFTALWDKRLQLSLNQDWLPNLRSKFPELGKVDDERLQAGVLEAVNEYYRWHCLYGAFCDGMGKKPSFRRLAKSLTDAVSLLETPGVLNRLYATRQLVERPLGPSAPEDLDYTWNPLKDPNLVVDKLKELVALVEEAVKLDVRSIDRSKNGDLINAAMPLRALWVDEAKQSGTFWKAASRYSPAVRFITHCLKLLDVRANERLVYDFRTRLAAHP